MAERAGFEPAWGGKAPNRFRVGAGMTASVPLRNNAVLDRRIFSMVNRGLTGTIGFFATDQDGRKQADIILYDSTTAITNFLWHQAAVRAIT